MMTESHRVTPGQEDALPPDDMFVEGGPDVGVGGLSVVRVMAAPEGAITLDDDEDDPGPPLRWIVGGIPSGLVRPGLVLMGDLFVRNEATSVGVTVSALLDFRDFDQVLDEHEATERGELLAPWATHMLYDLAAQEARRLLVSIGQSPETVPSQTPPLS